MASITSILLDGADFGRYSMADGNKPSKILSSLSQVNLFVGPNNSGKSRFLRELAKIKPLQFTPSENLSILKEATNEVQTKLSSIISDKIEVNGFKKAAYELPNLEFIVEGESLGKDLFKLVNQLAKCTSSNISITTSGSFGQDHVTLASQLKKVGETIKKKLGPAIESGAACYKFERIYIPTLRGLRRFKETTLDCYEERTRSDYFSKGAIPQIFTGLSLYDQVRDLLLGDLSARQSVSSFQDFLSKEFFDNLPVALIPRKESDVLYIKIGEEEELPIFELGDGIQMIIIITFPLFKLGNTPALVFIEEPELYLHPGLQRVLLRTLTKFSNYEYFIATHSNHFLDLSLDFENVAIFTFHKKLEDSEHPEKKAHFNIEQASNHDTRILQMLGIKNSSVFLSNCTIWVEGITDRRYLSKFLFLYLEKLRKESPDKITPFLPKEDLHYSFVEYAGSNITHWSFLNDIDDPIEVERLCSRLFLITDKDASKNKTERHIKLKQKLKDDYHCLNCREIENLLPPTIIQEVLAEYEKSSSHIPALIYDEYKEIPLGNYIETKLTGIKKRKGSYATESGTISDKLGFCNKSISLLNKFEDLTKEAQELTKKLYTFIQKMNK